MGVDLQIRELVDDFHVMAPDRAMKPCLLIWMRLSCETIEWDILELKRQSTSCSGRLYSLEKRYKVQRVEPCLGAIIIMSVPRTLPCE